MADYDNSSNKDNDFDYMFKLLIIGNSSVGKTSVLFRYADEQFSSAFVSTVGIDFKVKTIDRNNQRIKLQIWDTAGQERYRTITTAYYRGALGFLLMYDITNEDSFQAVADWSTQIKTWGWESAQIILVGNKSDMERDRVVSKERGMELAEALGYDFFEVSAKSGNMVSEVFDRLVDNICVNMSDQLEQITPGTNGQAPGNTNAEGVNLNEPGVLDNIGSKCGCA